jgi:hypothetical protein
VTRASSFSRWAARLAIGALLGGLACSDPAPQIFNLVTEDFEERCDGVPCGWERLGGTPEQVRYVETFHAGDHGLELTGDSVAARGPGGSPMMVQVISGSLQGQLVAVCDPGATLRLSVGLIQTTGFDGGMPAAVDTLVADFQPAVEWDDPQVRTLIATGVFTDGGLSGGFVSGTFRITGMTLEKRGEGSCVVTRVLVDDVIAVRGIDC